MNGPTPNGDAPPDGPDAPYGHAGMQSSDEIRAADSAVERARIVAYRSSPVKVTPMQKVDQPMENRAGMVSIRAAPKPIAKPKDGNHANRRHHLLRQLEKARLCGINLRVKSALFKAKPKSQEKLRFPRRSGLPNKSTPPSYRFPSNHTHVAGETRSGKKEKMGDKCLARPYFLSADLGATGHAVVQKTTIYPYTNKGVATASKHENGLSCSVHGAKSKSGINHWMNDLDDDDDAPTDATKGTQPIPPSANMLTLNINLPSCLEREDHRNFF